MHDRKLALGEAIEKILHKGEVKQAALSKDKQEALELYRNEDSENNKENYKGIEEEMYGEAANGNFIIHKKGCTCCKRMINGISEYTSTVTG